MHTLEDFTAHSNWCELVLVSMGHQNIFLHVGDAVRVQARNGKQVAPLVTGKLSRISCASLYNNFTFKGTFGSSDFIHSLLGEATDHIVRIIPPIRTYPLPLMPLPHAESSIRLRPQPRTRQRQPALTVGWTGPI